VRLILLLVLVLCSCKYNPSPVIPGNQVNHASNSTVALVAPESFFDKEGDQWAFCTGAFISQYEVLTANHCVTEIGDKINIATYRDYVQTDGTFADRSFTKFQVIKMFKDADLALLRVVKEEKDILPPHTVLYLDDRPPNVGEQVYIVGHPNHALWTYTIAIVSNSLRMVDKFGEPRKFFQHQTPVFEGNSGGPVISMYGKLVGVVSMYTPGIAQLNISVHVDEIREFLGRK
jgi:serine protease Do